MIVLYNMLLLVFVLMGLPVLLPLTLRSKKRRRSLWPRLWLNRSQGTFPEGPRPIWVHALSVGEVLSSEPLLRGLRSRFPHRRVFFSSSTLTGYRMACDRFASLTTRIVYFPLDLPPSVKRAIRSINPALLILVETDIWPNFMYQIRRSRVPALLVNARLSERSLRGYKRFSFLFKPLFSTFVRICVQSMMDADRFAALGLDREKIYLAGNLKFDQSAIHAASPDTGSIRRALGITANQPVLVAGSTHEGEELILLEAMERLRERWPSLVLILAPRDPGRATSVLQLAQATAFSAGLLSHLKAHPPESSPDIILVDSLGQLRALYALSEVSFVGGSLVRQGGHNPLEPAAWGKPVLFGPDMRDFSTMSGDLLSAGAAVRVQDTEALCRAVDRFLADPRESQEMGKRAWAFFKAQGGAVERILNLAAGYLQE